MWPVRESRRHASRVRPVRMLSSRIALILAAFASQVVAQPVRYDLIDGSRIIDECVDCDGPPIIREVSGSFLLEQIPSLVCCIWEITELEFTDEAGEYAGRGTGTYGTSEFGPDDTTTQSIDLQLDVAGRDVRFASDAVPIDTLFPAVEIAASEPGSEGQARALTLVLVAAPRVDEWIEYELLPGDEGGQEGSYLDLQCPNCLLIRSFIPIDGSFRLGKATDTLGPNGLYVIRSAEFEDLLDEEEQFDTIVSGGGVYDVRGENRSFVQSSRWQVRINDKPLVLVGDEDEVPRNVLFPDLSLFAREPDLHGGINYSLRLVARPVDAPTVEFRRGDPNDDGSVDVSDAVFVLLWRFSGGTPPSCMDAADANGDARHDLSDAVSILSFLFQGGPEPPDPGVRCGIAPKAEARCDLYTSCGP